MLKNIKYIVWVITGTIIIFSGVVIYSYFYGRSVEKKIWEERDEDVRVITLIDTVKLPADTLIIEVETWKFKIDTIVRTDTVIVRIKPETEYAEYTTEIENPCQLKIRYYYDPPIFQLIKINQYRVESQTVITKTVEKPRRLWSLWVTVNSVIMPEVDKGSDIFTIGFRYDRPQWSLGLGWYPQIYQINFGMKII